MYETTSGFCNYDGRASRDRRRKRFGGGGDHERRNGTCSGVGHCPREMTIQARRGWSRESESVRNRIGSVSSAEDSTTNRKEKNKEQNRIGIESKETLDGVSREERMNKDSTF